MQGLLKDERLNAGYGRTFCENQTKKGCRHLPDVDKGCELRKEQDWRQTDKVDEAHIAEKEDSVGLFVPTQHSLDSNRVAGVEGSRQEAQSISSGAAGPLCVTAVC